jgi:CMP-N-acetylneuraminic acid synthetase
VIKKYNSLCNNKTGFLIIPHQVDIDDENDFNFAKYLLKENLIK